jgi:hypothetical protein
MTGFLFLFGLLNLITVIVWAFKNLDDVRVHAPHQRALMSKFLTSGGVFLIAAYIFWIV